jgi:hypothetical protein
VTGKQNGVGLRRHNIMSTAQRSINHPACNASSNMKVVSLLRLLLPGYHVLLYTSA